MSRRLTNWAAFLLFSIAGTANAEIVPDFLMGTDPEFVALPQVKDFRRDFKGVWVQALRRPEAEYQRMAAETVVKAHRYGIPSLVDLIPDLVRILTAPTSHPSARFAAARALIELDSRNAAADLFESGRRYGADLRQLVEPALAQWDFVPARAVWTKRLATMETLPRDLILAIRGLAQVRDVTALSVVSRISSDPLRPFDARLEAARAAGEIADSGLEADAEELAHDRRRSPLVSRLCAVRLLARHSSESAQRLLVELANDADPSVAAGALKRLNEIDSNLVLPIAESAMKNADPIVRAEGATAFLHVPTPERIVVLARLLDDDHPFVRKLTSEGLYRLAEKPEYDALIRTESMRILSGERWQGQEQAALVLGILGHKPAAARFVELLESTRPEVMIHTAWGLRKLELPSTIPAIVDRIRRQTDARRTRSIPGVEKQVAHLFEACGRMKSREAQPLMMKYVPKDRSIDIARSAAIWALGRIYEGTPNDDVSSALMGRVQDDDPQNPESEFVKQMSVVSLVHMKETGHAAALRATIFPRMPPSALGLATRWAVRELTGEELPTPVPRPVRDGVWFLEPLDAPQAGSP